MFEINYSQLIQYEILEKLVTSIFPHVWALIPEYPKQILRPMSGSSYEGNKQHKMGYGFEAKQLK